MNVKFTNFVHIGKMRHGNLDNTLAAAVDAAVEIGNIDEALAMLDAEIDANETADAHYLRGRLLWKLGRKTDAMSSYSKAVALDPTSPAAAALELARDVMNYFNPDLYNP